MNSKGAFRRGKMGKAFVEPVLGEKKTCCTKSSSPPGCREDCCLLFLRQTEEGAALELLEEIVVLGRVCVPQCLWARND